MPANAARIMHALFESCARDAACAGAYPDLEARFDGVFERFDEHPVTVPAKHPRTGEEIGIVFDGTRLAGGLVMAAAQTPVIPQLPGLIHALSQGNDDGLKHLSWSAMPPPGDSPTVSRSPPCARSPTPSPKRISSSTGGSRPTRPPWPKCRGDRCRSSGTARPGSTRSRIPAPGRWRRSDVPTLILAGQLDPITPPAWAYDTALSLTNSYVAEVPGYGHSPTFSGPCPTSMALEFLGNPTGPPDDSCLAEMKVEFAVPQGE